MPVALIEHADRVISKRELMDRVWPKLVVEEQTFSTDPGVAQVLGLSAITTIPGRGYRFTFATRRYRSRITVTTIAFDAEAGDTGQELLPLPPPLIGRER